MLDAATRARFLDQLAMLGCPARAAAAVGIAPVSAYALRRRSARFAVAWRDALAIGYERLEAAALRHLLDGAAPLDLAAALALLDRHRAGAGAAPVAPPRARRGQRHALGPAGAELARRLQLYAGATPRVRRTPVSPAAAAEVDAIERAAEADWVREDESGASRIDPDAGTGTDAADTDAGAGVAPGVDTDAHAGTDAADKSATSRAGVATAIDTVAVPPAAAGSSPPSSCSPAQVGGQAARTPHVAALLHPETRPSRADDPSDGPRGPSHEGPSNAGSPAPAVESATAIRSAADAVWHPRSSAPERAGDRSAVDAPVGAAAAAAPAAPPPAESVALPDPARHAVPDAWQATLDARDGAGRSVRPAEAPAGRVAGAPPPGVTAAPRPRVWA